jgi:2-oxoglutarate ferredoxin oxidoreductase subunit beta
MHDGSTVRFRKTHEGYDPTDREAAYAHVRACQGRGEVATGLLFLDENGQDMHAVSKTVETPLVDLPYEQLCPGNSALQELMEGFR